MPKTRREKIASYDKQITQLLKRKKAEVDKHKETNAKGEPNALSSVGALWKALLQKPAEPTGQNTAPREPQERNSSIYQPCDAF